MTLSASAQAAGARSQIYTLLAAVFRRPLDAGQIEGLRSPEMLAALAAAGIAPGEAFRDDDTEVLRDALAVDFTNIFHHPEGKIMPYEGLMLAHEDELHGPKSEEVERFLAGVGYRVPPERGEMADHISVELEFMADLARREAEAIEAGDEETARKAHDVQRDFLDRHLGRWVGIFARRVTERAEAPFYASFAQAVADFVADEAEAFAEDVRETG